MQFLFSLAVGTRKGLFNHPLLANLLKGSDEYLPRVNTSINILPE
jgi:hypothetical protein